MYERVGRNVYTKILKLYLLDLIIIDFLVYKTIAKSCLFCKYFSKITNEIVRFNLGLTCSSVLKKEHSKSTLSSDMVKHELRVASKELRVRSESLKTRVDSIKAQFKIQMCDFKSTSYELISTNY